MGLLSKPNSFKKGEAAAEQVARCPAAQLALWKRCAFSVRDSAHVLVYDKHLTSHEVTREVALQAPLLREMQDEARSRRGEASSTICCTKFLANCNCRQTAGLVWLEQTCGKMHHRCNCYCLHS